MHQEMRRVGRWSRNVCVYFKPKGGVSLPIPPHMTVDTHHLHHFDDNQRKKTKKRDDFNYEVIFDLTVLLVLPVREGGRVLLSIFHFPRTLMSHDSCYLDCWRSALVNLSLPHDLYSFTFDMQL